MANLADKRQISGPTALDTTETEWESLGDITVPGGVSAIVGIQAVAIIQTATDAEGALGVCKLSSENQPVGGQLKPYVFICPTLMGPAGTLVNSGTDAEVPVHQCNIPVLDRDVIKIEMKLTLAQTGSCNGIVGLLFE